MKGLPVILAAWAPALAAVAVGGVTGLGWEQALRMVVTALVYAPVAAIVLGIRQLTVAVITAGLAIASGWLALVMMIRRIPALDPPLDQALESAEALGITAMHLSELAALGVLIWVLGPRGPRAPGFAMGGAAILLDLVLTALRLGGWEVAIPLQLLPLGIALVSFLAGAALTVGRWRRGSGIPRIVLAWFTLGAALMVASYGFVFPGTPAVVVNLGTALFILAQSLLPTAILAAVFGGAGAVIDRRLVTGMVWAQALATAIGLYVVVDALALGLGAGRTLAGGLAAALLALTFSIMFGVFRGLTGLIFFGPGSSVRRVLAGLGSRLSDGGADDGLSGLAEALRATWHLRSVAVFAGVAEDEIARAGEPGGGEPGAGAPGAAVLEHELRAGGAPIGRIVCTAADPAVLDNIVGPMLEEIGGLVAVAMQLALTGRDLATLRDRTRGVSREERRLLHRELHDELAPALAGIGFAMAGARRLIAAAGGRAGPARSPGSVSAPDPAVNLDAAPYPGAPDAAASHARALAEVQDELAATTERVRRLARALLPAALDAGDLDGALRELARRFSGGGCAVTAAAPGTDGLDGEAQLTVYLVLADAVDILSRETATTSIRLDVGIAEDPAPRARGVIVRLRSDPLPELAAERVAAAIARRCAEAGGSFTSDLTLGRGTAVIPR